MDRLLLPEPDNWAKRFPDEFYIELYRLKGWVWPGMSTNRYQICAQYSNDIVWDRLEDGLREELENRNPMLPSGERGSKHQHLREEAERKLRAYLAAVIIIMQVSVDWYDFKANINRRFPSRRDNRPLPMRLPRSPRPHP